MTGYDIIGDVHGCAFELMELLGRLGYERDGDGPYRHPERTAVFIGDLVDRGEDQLRVLEIVKGMHDGGSAQVLMGNHEFNAICFATPDPDAPGEFLRPRTRKNIAGHSKFTKQLTEEQQQHYLDWFRTLPLWLELDGPDGIKLRLIHACWHQDSMEVVGESARLTTDDHYIEASRKGSALYRAVENLLKGPEVSLGRHGPYFDHDKEPRKSARARWWKPDARTLHELADIRGMKTDDDLEFGPLPDEEVTDFDFSLIYTDDVPVIYGHYWFDWENHRDHVSEYTACVDFGAVGKSGRLVAYRWNGEPTISPENYVPHVAVAATPSD